MMFLVFSTLTILSNSKTDYKRFRLPKEVLFYTNVVGEGAKHHHLLTIPWLKGQTNLKFSLKVPAYQCVNSFTQS